MSGNLTKTLLYRLWSVVSYFLMRRFDRIGPVLHESLAISIVKISHSPSVIFGGNGYDVMDKRRVLVEFASNEDKACVETVNDGLDDEDESVMHLILSQANGQVIAEKSAFSSKRVHWVSIPDSVEEVCEKFFYWCKGLSHVTFGELSSLKQIGTGAFYGSGLRESHIPDGVEELCDKCFHQCKRLSRVTFGEASLLKRIGVEAFSECGLRELHIPDSVEEVCDQCFAACGNLSRVTFGQFSSLKRLGVGAFLKSHLEQIRIPDTVEELCDGCFHKCKNLSRVTFGHSSSLKRIGVGCFCGTGLRSFSLPASVVSVGGSLFAQCPLKTLVIRDVNSPFTVVDSLLLSRDCRICYSCIGKLRDVVVPDSVEELCDRCFSWCKSLSRCSFGQSSSLKRIGIAAFAFSDLREIHIPQSVEELCNKCFFFCMGLERITFDESSSLMLVDPDAFRGTALREIRIPPSVQGLVRQIVEPRVRVVLVRPTAETYSSNSE